MLRINELSNFKNELGKGHSVANKIARVSVPLWLIAAGGDTDHGGTETRIGMLASEF